MKENPTCREKYNRGLAIKGLREVFATTRFASDEERDILFDSYMINIDELVAHACMHRINPYWYTLTIKHMLAKDRKARQR